MMKTWMRWGTYAVGVGLALVPMTGRAGEDATPEARRTLVMVQPLAGRLGQVGASVEHAVGSRVTLMGAVQASVAFLGGDYGIAPGAGFHSTTWGVGVEPGVHFFLTGRAPEGFWVGPHLELSTQRELSQSTSVFVEEPSQYFTVERTSRRVSYGGSLRLGYTAIVSPGLTVQAGVGLAVFDEHTTTFTPRQVSPVQDGPLGPLGVLLGSSGATRNWSVAPRMTVALGWAL